MNCGSEIVCQLSRVKVTSRIFSWVTLTLTVRCSKLTVVTDQGTTAKRSSYATMTYSMQPLSLMMTSSILPEPAPPWNWIVAPMTTLTRRTCVEDVVPTPPAWERFSVRCCTSWATAEPAPRASRQAASPPPAHPFRCLITSPLPPDQANSSNP